MRQVKLGQVVIFSKLLYFSVGVFFFIGHVEYVCYFSIIYILLSYFELAFIFIFAVLVILFCAFLIFITF